MDESSYTPRKPLGDPVTALWRRRGVALSVTLAAIVLPSLLFSLAVRVPVKHKPEFLLRMLCGPFGSFFPFPDARFEGDYVSLLWITPMTFFWSAKPSCVTVLISAFGIFFWLGLRHRFRDGKCLISAVAENQMCQDL